jgi:hypothetical protein
MTETITEDWLDILDQSNYEPDDDDSNTYQSYRFRELDINSVTVKNYEKTLCKSLIEQVSMFIPPSGSFENSDLRRYLELICSYETSSTDLILGLSLADQIRLTFSDMKTSTICDRYPEINLAEKRRYRCVAEYLIRQGELTKLRDENGKLIKKIGNMQKAVVLYRPLPKLLQTLKKSGLGNLIKIDKKKNATNKEKTLINLDNKVKK